MAQSTFYTSTSDGYLTQNNVTYATAHGAATSDGTLHNNLSTLRIGQLFHTDSKYYLYRAFVFFDTSTLADDATIISATLTLFTNSKANVDTDFNIVTRDGTPDHPEDPFVTGDYLHSHYSSDGGSINTVNIGATLHDANIIDLNATGLGWISKTGTTKFALISSRDIDSDIPDGKEEIYFGARTLAGGTSHVAKLIVTYDVESYPTVTTQAATNIESVSVKGNGNLTDGGVATEYGFEYGLTETPTWKISSTKNIGEGAFSLNINGLEPSTTYYYRAYATNSKGTAYGGWVSFTTKALPSYGMYEEDNVATICFYVRKVGGKWSIKHGPYTTDQADIEITKILTEGKGKYQIKFESDVLTGISAGVMCKVDIKAR